MTRWRWLQLGGVGMIVLAGSAWALVECRMDESARRDDQARSRSASPPAPGVQRQYDADGRLVREQWVNAAGAPHGEVREFHANGALRYQAQYVDGRRQGLEKGFRDDASLSRLAYIGVDGRELAAASFLADGRLSSLRCADRPLLEGRDHDWCGFAGRPSEVLLHSEHGLLGRESWLRGELLSRDELDEWGRLLGSVRVADGQRVTVRYFPNGQPNTESRFRVDGRQDGEVREGREREWTPDGRLLRETVWEKGQSLISTLWYPSGQLKERRLVQSDVRLAAQPVLRIEQFWENGKLSYRGAQIDGVGVGSHERFDEQGRLLLEVRLDASGVPLMRIEYDPQTGAVLRADRLEHDEAGSAPPARSGQGFF